MTYKKGDAMICIGKMLEEREKRPGLWIGAGNEWAKVASFGSEDRAETFRKYLEYFMGMSGSEEEVTAWRNE